MGLSQAPHSGVAVEVPGRELGIPGRAPGPGAVPRLLERDGIGRFMDLGSFIDRGNHEPARPVYLAILAVKCALLAVRCSVHGRKWPARPTDRTAGGRPDLLVASDRDPLENQRRAVVIVERCLPTKRLIFRMGLPMKGSCSFAGSATFGAQYSGKSKG